jgi:hypothetical protein
MRACGEDFLGEWELWCFVGVFEKLWCFDVVIFVV